jgi:hypothetical protein
MELTESLAWECDVTDNGTSQTLRGTCEVPQLKLTLDQLAEYVMLASDTAMSISEARQYIAELAIVSRREDIVAAAKAKAKRALDPLAKAKAMLAEAKKSGDKERAAKILAALEAL